MWRFILAVIGTGFISLFSLSVQADETTTTVVEKRTIVSPAPKAICTPVAGRWEGNIWIDAHQVCKYEGRSEGVAWVNDYWSCTVATADGTCTSWVLNPGHWVKTLD